MDQPVSFQQNLIKACNAVGRRFRADVSIPQWRLSAVKLYRSLEGRERDAALALVPGSARAKQNPTEQTLKMQEGMDKY